MQGLLNNILERRKAVIAQAFGVNIVKSNMNNDLSKGGVGSGRKKGELVRIGNKIGSKVATYQRKATNEVGDKHFVSIGGKHRVVHARDIFDHERHKEVNTPEKIAARSAYDDENLSKAHGEGSRGGKVVGHTKSGKPIYGSASASHESYKNFTPQDHRDAVKIHEEANRHDQAESHHEEAKRIVTDKSAKKRGLNTSDDNKKQLKQHLKDNEEHFYDVVSKHYEPSDDGESEHTMLENLSKHKDISKILSKLGKKK